MLYTLYVVDLALMYLCCMCDHNETFIIKAPLALMPAVPEAAGLPSYRISVTLYHHTS